MDISATQLVKQEKFLASVIKEEESWKNQCDCLLIPYCGIKNKDCHDCRPSIQHTRKIVKLAFAMTVNKRKQSVRTIMVGVNLKYAFKEIRKNVFRKFKQINKSENF